MGGNHQSKNQRNLKSIGNVVVGADKAIAGWVAERIPAFEASDRCVSLGVVKSGRVVAGVVFERYNGVHIEASIAAEDGGGWADRKTLRTLFHYPFEQLNCQAITVLVPATNLKSLNLATKLGFEPEALIKYAAHDGSALVVLKMFRDKCKWIKPDGKKFSTKSA